MAQGILIHGTEFVIIKPVTSKKAISPEAALPPLLKGYPEASKGAQKG